MSAKLIPLTSHRNAFTWLGLCTFDENPSKVPRIVFIIFHACLFVSWICGVISSAVFAMRNIMTDLEGSLHALFQVNLYAGIIYASMVAVVVRHKIKHILLKLAEIFDNATDPVSYQILLEANKKCQWLWKFWFKFQIVTTINTGFLGLVSGVTCYRTYGKFDEKILYHPFKVSLPWDAETAVGYAGEIAFHLGPGQGYIFYNGALVLLFIAISYVHKALCDIHQNMLLFLDRVNKWEGEKQLCRIIHFQTVMKSLVLEAAEVYSPFVLVQLICLTIALACITFGLDSQFQHLSFDVSILLIALVVTGLNPFLYCRFGKRTTDNHSNLCHQLFYFNWVDLPVGLQKYFILIIGNMQRPLLFHGFGVVILDLETFRNILRTVITYYMAFKTFSG